MDLLKTEQAAISKELAAIEHEIKIHNTTYEEIRNNLTLALDLIEDCGQTYKKANDKIKKLLIQAIFKGFYIYNDAPIVPELTEPFDKIIPAIKSDIAKINSARVSTSNYLAETIKKAKCHIQRCFECGTLPDYNESPYSNESIFFGSKSSNKDFLVERAGIKPATSAMRMPRSIS